MQDQPDRLSTLPPISDELCRLPSGMLIADKNHELAELYHSEGGTKNVFDLVFQLAQDTLSERNASIIARRFALLGGVSQTLESIGQAEGVSRERVRQIVQKSLMKLGMKARRESSADRIGHPGTQLYRRLLDTIRPDEDQVVGRIRQFCATQCPHLDSAKLVAPLLGNILGGAKIARRSQEMMHQSLRLQQEPRRRIRRADIQDESANLWVTKRASTVLADVAWPDLTVALTVQEAMEMFSPQRAVSSEGTGHSGSFLSTKLQREVTFESGLERRFLHFLENSAEVLYYQEQPLKISLFKDGRSRLYFPDMLYVMCDGRTVVVEIKPCFEMALYGNWVKWEALRRYCHHHGYGHLITNGHRSLQQVASVDVCETMRTAILDAVAHGPLDWQAYRELREKNSIPNHAFLAIIMQDRLIWKLKPFSLRRSQSCQSGNLGNGEPFSELLGLAA